MWDTAVVVTRLGGPSDRVIFQARESGSEPRYVTTFEIEEHARPTTAIVVDGHQTKTMVVQFEQRTSNQWRWQLGTYTANVYSLGNNSQWTEKTSFEFALSDECLDEQGQTARGLSACSLQTEVVTECEDTHRGCSAQPTRRERVVQRDHGSFACN